MEELFLSGLPVDRIRACYEAAAGNEIASGKFANPDLSAALVANAFGYFLDRAGALPALPGCEHLGWPAVGLELERVVRFPWSGGRHPCLDVLINTATALVGVESKRYEPFRGKGEVDLSEAYTRPVWGSDMTRFEQMRDDLVARTIVFNHLDAAQLVKHAFGLRSAVQREEPRGKRPVLFYLYAEPSQWGDGRPVPQADLERHRREVTRFAGAVAGDEVSLVARSYKDVLATWRAAADQRVCAHAAAVELRFRP